MLFSNLQTGLSIRTGNFDVMHTGTVITHRGQPLVFTLADLGQLELRFTPGSGGEVDAEVKFTQERSDYLIVEFYNFQHDMIGSREPIRVGTLGKKALYLNYLVLTPTPDAERVVHYTWFIERE